MKYLLFIIHLYVRPSLSNLTIDNYNFAKVSRNFTDALKSKHHKFHTFRKIITPSLILVLIEFCCERNFIGFEKCFSDINRFDWMLFFAKFYWCFENPIRNFYQCLEFCFAGNFIDVLKSQNSYFLSIFIIFDKILLEFSLMILSNRQVRLYFTLIFNVYF